MLKLFPVPFGLQIVTENLSLHVLKNYDSFLAGVDEVASVEQDMQVHLVFSCLPILMTFQCFAFCQRVFPLAIGLGAIKQLSLISAGSGTTVRIPSVGMLLGSLKFGHAKRVFGIP